MVQPLERFVHRRSVTSATYSSLYYSIFSDRFDREQWAFQQGRHKYLQQLESPTSGFALLRRNTHRLEKGLTMRPRRNIFARDYIAETVSAYAGAATACDSCEADFGELKWAHDVLKHYFSVVGQDPVIEEQQRIFESVPAVAEASVRYIPYQRNVQSMPAISIDDITSLAKYRRSVRWFLPKAVEREKLDRSIAVAAQSPSACNRQPFVFRIFDDPEMVRKVASIPMGTAGYEHNIPVFIVIIGQMRNYFDERDRHLIYIDGSLAAMSFVFAAEVQGISTCCINWPDIEDREQKMANLLKLEGDERPVMCLAVGYPDPEGLVAYSQKKSVDELRKYN